MANSEENVRGTAESIRDSQVAAKNLFRAGIDLFNGTMKRTIELQSHVLELASKQNADSMHLWSQMFRYVPGSEQMFRLAENSTQQLIDTQKRVLEMVGQQTEDMAEASRAQGERVTRAAQRATEWPTADPGTEQERAKAG